MNALKEILVIATQNQILLDNYIKLSLRNFQVSISVENEIKMNFQIPNFNWLCHPTNVFFLSLEMCD